MDTQDVLLVRWSGNTRGTEQVRVMMKLMQAGLVIVVAAVLLTPVASQGCSRSKGEETFHAELFEWFLSRAQEMWRGVWGMKLCRHGYMVGRLDSKEGQASWVLIEFLFVSWWLMDA